MIIEYAQLLSTAHRVLDGKLTEVQFNGKIKKFRLLPGESIVTVESKLEIANRTCYNLSHQNHPSAVWARETNSNYVWLFQLFQETALEYTHRYGKIHKTWIELNDFLKRAPQNIVIRSRTAFPQAMPPEFKDQHDSIEAYKNYYLGPKAAFARWTNRPAPTWFQARYKDYHGTNFERTSSLG